MDDLKPEIKKERSSRVTLLLDIILIIGVFFVFAHYLLSAPVHERDVTVHITSNESLSKISTDLEDHNIIRSSFLFKIFISVLSLDKHIPYGDYLFNKDQNLFSVTWQIARGNHKVNPVKVTFTEGMNRNDMANLLADKISSFRRDLFLSDPRCKEGYLFPDTYFFFPLSTNDEIFSEITSNFDRKISLIKDEIGSSGKSLSDIIIMASILEKEAKGKDDIYIISGILWKRIKLGMPLQVDIAPETYKESDLPKNPVSNPGILAIKAAIHPVDSPYLFYLHDDFGQVHYAIDFSQHRSNIARYLK